MCGFRLAVTVGCPNLALPGHEQAGLIIHVSVTRASKRVTSMSIYGVFHTCTVSLVLRKVL